MNNNYLSDKLFLKQLDHQKEKEIYVKLISLSNSEYPREEIKGRATGGSINIDGTSAIRRSCSLSLVALEDDLIITDIYWCYDNKFKLEVGIKNFIDPEYPNIIWFNMGLYIITSFNINRGTSNLTISISGKDKMCRLNGEVSGNIAMQTDFGSIDYLTEIDRGNGATEIITVNKKLDIKTIIEKGVKEYGQEIAPNIIVNDLEEKGYELWEYRGDKPLYLFITVDSKEVIHATFNENIKVSYPESEYSIIPISNISKYYSMNTLDPYYNNNATKVKYCDIECYIAKLEYGDTAGYYQTPLVYNSELILNIGETVTSMLDKLKAMLGDYEYFYDLNGRFVFQKKKTYLQELFSPVNGNRLDPIMYFTEYSYKFGDEDLFITVSKNPNINNLKNDFSIWGKKSGNSLPFHIRYALNKKPKQYISEYSYSNNENDDKKIYTTDSYNWRELIYRMALDYQNHNSENDYLLKLEENNPEFVGGKTGYEQYYSDMLGFWRQCYNPLETDNDKYIQKYNNYEYYTQEDINADPTLTKWLYWNKLVHQDPNKLNFWIDFLDTTGELGKYSTYKIGCRSKAVNDNAVKTIYNKTTPEILYAVLSKGDTIESLTTEGIVYKPLQLPIDMEKLFAKSSQSISAIERANEFINQYSMIPESVSITAIPIYYLQPNTRVQIHGEDYTLDKISYNLNYNGTMTMTCNKIIKQV